MGGLTPGKRSQEDIDKANAAPAAASQRHAEPERSTETHSGLKRIASHQSVDEKIAGALRYLANDQMKMNTDKPWEQLDERTRSSTYIGTNVSEFTAEQQAAIKAAIMDADTHKTVLKNGNTFQSIDDVKFHEGKDGGTVIEVQGQPLMDVDLQKLIKSLYGQKDKFRDVKISGQASGITQDMGRAVAEAAQGYKQAMQEMNSSKNREQISQAGQEPPPPPQTGMVRL